MHNDSTALLVACELPSKINFQKLFEHAPLIFAANLDRKLLRQALRVAHPSTMFQYDLRLRVDLRHKPRLLLMQRLHSPRSEICKQSFEALLRRECARKLLLLARNLLLQPRELQLLEIVELPLHFDDPL